jgi:hypothetical protein
LDAERSLIDSLSHLGDTLEVMVYHVHGTYENSIATARAEYYETTDSFTPYVMFDGTDYVWLVDPSPEIYESSVKIAQGVTPSYNLYVDSAHADLTTGAIAMRIIAVDTLLTGQQEHVAYVNILEDSLPSAVLPGVFFYHVCRLQYQFPVMLAYPDTLDTVISFFHDSIPVDKMNTAVFVQDISSDSIKQTIMSPFEEVQ